MTGGGSNYYRAGDGAALRPGLVPASTSDPAAMGERAQQHQEAFDRARHRIAAGLAAVRELFGEAVYNELTRRFEDVAENAGEALHFRGRQVGMLRAVHDDEMIRQRLETARLAQRLRAAVAAYERRPAKRTPAWVRDAVATLSLYDEREPF